MRGGYLLSRIPIKARLLARMPLLVGTLENYPWLTQTRKGTSPAYIMGEEEDRFYTVEFSKDSILLTVHSKGSPLYYMQEAMLRLLGLLSSLEGLYEPDVRSLYPYLVNLLASGQFAQLSERLVSPKQERGLGVELVLARRVNALLRENSRLNGELNEERRKLRSVLSRFLIMRYGSAVDVEAASKETGIGAKEVEDAVRRMEELGYRSIKTGERRFSLARI